MDTVLEDKVVVTTSELADVLSPYLPAIDAEYEQACKLSLEYGVTTKERDMSNWFPQGTVVEVSRHTNDYFGNIFPVYQGNTYYRGYLIRHPDLWECAVVIYQPFLPSQLAAFNPFSTMRPAVTCLGAPPADWVESIVIAFIENERELLVALKQTERYQRIDRKLYRGKRLKK